LGSRDVTVRKAAVSRPPIWVRFWCDRRGVVAVAVAILVPVLIGFAGLGVEVGMWFWIQRQNQSAADAAAISAGLEYAAQIQRGVATDPAAAAAAATIAANCSLFSTGSSSSNAVCPWRSSASNTVTLYPCYEYNVGGSCNTSNSNGVLPNAVQVVLTQPFNTTFANIVTAIWGPSVNTVNITTTAIAEFSQTSTACLLARDLTAANAVFVDNVTLTNQNCRVASNSSSASALNCNGCTIVGPTTAVGGDSVSNGGQLNGSPNRTYASAISDPYAATLTHAFLTARMPTTTPCSPQITGSAGAKTYSYLRNCVISGGPQNSFPSNVTIKLLPGAQIASGLWFTGNGTIILSPGTYWITDGNLSNSMGLTGNITLGCSGGLGVTIIFTTMLGSAGTIGTLSEIGNVTTILNAPGPGLAYAGLLMIQDPIAGATSGTIGGNPTSTLSGLIYFPKSNLSLAGPIQTDSSNCLVAVANSLYLTGNIGLNDSGCQTAGLATVPTILSVFLAV
jgi:Flp pilus assembly protein TadG